MNENYVLYGYLSDGNKGYILS